MTTDTVHYNPPKYRTGDLLVDLRTNVTFRAGRISCFIGATGTPYYEYVNGDDTRFICEKYLALVSTQKTLKPATKKEINSLILGE